MTDSWNWTGPGRPRLQEAEARFETTHGNTFVAKGDERDGGVELFTIDKHAADLIDQATIGLLNQTGIYGAGENRITRGDQVEWWTRLEGEQSLKRRWTGMIEEVSHQRRPGDVRTVSLTADDYVFGTLSDRLVYRVWDNDSIVDIITDVATRDAGLSVSLPSESEVTDTATLASNGLNALEVVETMAKRAGLLLYSDHETLVAEEIDQLDTKVTLSEENVTDAIGGNYDHVEQPDDYASFYRVEGGDAAELDDEQETADGWYEVTEDDRLEVQISATRSKLERVELIPRQVEERDEPIVVRIQRDDGGSPANPEDQNADITRQEVQPSDPRWIDEDWSRWIFQAHIIHDEDPWLIVETDGSEGQEVRINESGELTYRTYYAYPVLAESTDTTAENQYGRVERKHEDESVRTLREAQNVADAKIAESNRPREIFSFPAASPSTYRLAFGDAIELNFPKDGAVGRYIVTDITETWGQAVDLRVDITARSEESLT